MLLFVPEKMPNERKLFLSPLTLESDISTSTRSIQVILFYKKCSLDVLLNLQRSGVDCLFLPTFCILFEGIASYLKG
jgi:hypothetical protein